VIYFNRIGAILKFDPYVDLELALPHFLHTSDFAVKTYHVL